MSLTEVSGEKALAMRIPVRGSFGKKIFRENSPFGKFGKGNGNGFKNDSRSCYYRPIHLILVAIPSRSFPSRSFSSLSSLPGEKENSFPNFLFSHPVFRRYIYLTIVPMCFQKCVKSRLFIVSKLVPIFGCVYTHKYHGKT